jgi:hypothetical protein
MLFRSTGGKGARPPVSLRRTSSFLRDDSDRSHTACHHGSIFQGFVFPMILRVDLRQYGSVLRKKSSADRWND